MGHQHSHNHLTKDTKDRNLMISIVLNILITAAQVVGGLVSGSLSLLSDALHNFSDVISLIVSYIASKLSKQKASFNRTFGYKRAEILAAFVNASTLIIVAFILIKEAIHRFQDPQTIDSGLVIWLAILAIAFNGFSVLLLKKDSNHNLNLKSAYLHLLTDMLASVAVLVGGLLMKYYELFWVDSLLTLLIALYLIWVGFDLLKSSTRMLMLFTPDYIDIKEVVRTVNKLPKVKKLHHVHIWNLSDHELHLEAHLDLEENMSITEFDELLHRIEMELHEKFDINHVTIQPEFDKNDPKEVIVQD
ncbi:cation diffusion facilitator family transporter [Mangrovimonas sp. AS39]|uniref:cation diffusion facilitator family transporter n=1 Tax=Mangrovimonas TaxID=1211036 RepID=UPI00141E5046|nr:MULTISPECIES: cation diffusion facilitator family transporter [Mangrovimonas]MCF1190367.1 cation diffusion facilitator family transporter [Mangrovimonas futianensis]MCF1193880.1 cation diffusion facilitator family transporter [Mangrovimonas futianensis]NIK90916.1 cation transporter [Mangrovimonas sp. CR14]